MASLTLDVVVSLPDELNRRAIELSGVLADRMREQGASSYFRLGKPFDGGAGDCAPHVSLFMLAVDAADIPDVVAATRWVAAGIPGLVAEGERYQHNPVGAPELYFRRTQRWIDLQRAVVAAVEPLRRGRLRDTDPAGQDVRGLIADPATDPAQRDQLVRYGYDEIADRFNPHVTLAWPVDPDFRVDLADLAPAEFSGTLSGLAVYAMSPHGTCTTLHGTAEFDAPELAAR